MQKSNLRWIWWVAVGLVVVVLAAITVLAQPRQSDDEVATDETSSEEERPSGSDGLGSGANEETAVSEGEELPRTGPESMAIPAIGSAVVTYLVFLNIRLRRERKTLY
jgi:hypothetical protein